MPRRYAVYARVSDDGQIDNSSLASQERLALEYGGSQQWEHVETIRDQGSRDTLERTQTARLFQLLEEGQVDTVLLYKVDRAGGESEVFSRLFGAIYAADALVAIVEKRRLYENLMDLMHDTVFDRAVSEYELYNIRKRTSQGTLDHLERGSFLMNPLYGYTLTREMRDGININVPVVDNEPAKIVRHVIRSIAKGASVPEVCKGLNDKGIPGPFRRGWNGTTIRNMVREHGTKYAGQPWPYSRKVNKSKTVNVEYQYPALVTLDEVIEARRSLDVNRGGTYKTRPFQGIITCVSCGRNAAIRTSGSKWWTSACNSYATWHNYSSNGKERDFEMCPHHISIGEIEKRLRAWLNGEGEDSLERAITRLQALHVTVLNRRKLYELEQERDEREKESLINKLLKASDFDSVLEALNEKLSGLEESMRLRQQRIRETHVDEPELASILQRLGVEPLEFPSKGKSGVRRLGHGFDFQAKVGELLDALNRGHPKDINRQMRELGLKISANYFLPQKSERVESIKIELDPTELAGMSQDAYTPFDVPSETG